ncbi:Uncharacterised protein [Yersinia intermedia]|nr:Uncharacterised protein [Yersinia intermedia]
MKEYVIPTVLVAVSVVSLSLVAVSMLDLLGDGLNISGVCIDNLHIYRKHC